jgi:hypothetical protein
MADLPLSGSPPLDLLRQRRRRAGRFAITAAAYSAFVIAANAMLLAVGGRGGLGPGTLPDGWLPALVAMPAVAAALAFAMVCLLHGGRSREGFGTGRGVLVALLTCIAYGAIGLAIGQGLAQFQPSPARAGPGLAWSMTVFGLFPAAASSLALGIGGWIGSHRSAWEVALAPAAGNALTPSHGPAAGPARAAAAEASPWAFARLYFIAALVLTVPVAMLLQTSDHRRWQPFAGSLFAALAAGAWARLLHRPRPDGRFGAGRGAVVAVLAYLSFLVVYLPASELLEPHTRSASSIALESIVIGLYVFLQGSPLLPVLVGACLGALPLCDIRSAPARLLLALRTEPRRVVSAAGAEWRLFCGRLTTGLHRLDRGIADGWNALVEQAAGSRLASSMIGSVGICWFLAAASVAFLLARRGPASSGDYEELWVLAFPSAVALAAGAAAWLGARRGATALPPRWRLAAVGASATAAITAGILFYAHVA